MIENKPDFKKNLSSKKTPPNKSDISYDITSEGYESKEIIPYKGDGTPKSDIGVISLVPIEKSLEIDKIKSSQLDKAQINKLSKDKKNSEYFKQEKLSKKIQELKTIVIPTLLTLIAKFGVTKATELVNKEKSEIQNKLSKIKLCPSKPEIEKIIKTKNKLVKIIENSLKIIDITVKSLGIVEGLLIIIETSFKIFKNLPIPVSTGVPGVPGLPTNVILGIQDNKDKLLKRIESLKKINESILGILILLKSTLELVLKLLNLLDMLLQSCIQEDQENQEDRETNLLATLQNLTLEQSNQESPVVTNINGFTMGVETEPKISTLSIKRRRAIATNKQGIVMLTGEWSFSSIDQILINELIFYIQQNDLRAD